MIKKSLLDKFTHDYFFTTFNFGGEDRVFKYECLNYGAKFANLQEKLYHYNRGSQSMTSGNEHKLSDCMIFGCKTLNDVLLRTKQLQNAKDDKERDDIFAKWKKEALDAGIKF